MIDGNIAIDLIDADTNEKMDIDRLIRRQLHIGDTFSYQGHHYKVTTRHFEDLSQSISKIPVVKIVAERI